MSVACLLPGAAQNKHRDGTVPARIRQSHTLVFEDDFDGDALDPEKWNTSFLWGPDVTINDEEQYYTDTMRGGPGVDPFSLSGSNLGITATYAGEGQAENGQNYHSGIITTYDSFIVRPGDYIEVCAKMPCNVSGFWGAIWLLNHKYGVAGPNGQLDPEIDWEFVNGPGGKFGGGPYTTDAITSALHLNNGFCTIDGRGFGCNGFQSDAVSQMCDGRPLSRRPARGFPYVRDMGDSCTDFHTYGWEWENDRLLYYMDGVVQHSICDEGVVPQVDMYLLINQAVGGGFPGEATPGDYPATMLVDYARVYRRS